MINMKKMVTLTLMLLMSSTLYANEGIWLPLASNDAPAKGQPVLQPAKYIIYQLHLQQMKAQLANVSTDPSETIIISLPTPDGGSMSFKVWETPLMAKGLADKYPEIKNYTGVSLDDPFVTAKINVTTFGFDAMIFAGDDTYFIDPYTRSDDRYYFCYYKRDYPFQANNSIACNTEDDIYVSNNEDLTKDEADRIGGGGLPPIQMKVNGTSRRKYRLALACTGEYAVAVTTGTPTKPAVLSAMNTSMSRVNGVFEREMNITMELIANNDLIIYLDGTIDPYSNGSGSTMLTENQANLTSVIGDVNYDIGHVFSTGGGGIATLASVCKASSKARGVTGRSNPVGDPFDIDYVAHEMGHQYGATHTFNSGSGSCGGANAVMISAYEPGSASTIMGYASLCAPDNIQGYSDDYFHAKSLDQMYENVTDLTSGGLCPSIVASGNTPPVFTALGQSNTIPYLTPFELEAPIVTDVDHDSMTYCWEQYNLGDFKSTFINTRKFGPIFRSFLPSGSRWRVFPILDSILNNTTSYLGEKLPDTDRVLTFKLTVRDMYNGHGGFNISDDSVVLDVVKTAGPFLVQSPNTASDYWQVGSTVEVKWDVANTDVAPVSCSNVDIYLSIDGGYTYPFTLASNTPNDGTEMITVPTGSNTVNARVKVKAANNVFFDLSNHNFKINVWPASVSNTKAASKTKVYPVPAKNILNIETDRAYDVQVLNTIGQTVWSSSVDGSTTVTVSGWSAGVYYVKFNSGVSGDSFVKTIVIK